MIGKKLRASGYHCMSGGHAIGVVPRGNQSSSKSGDGNDAEASLPSNPGRYTELRANQVGLS